MQCVPLTYDLFVLFGLAVLAEYGKNSPWNRPRVMLCDPFSMYLLQSLSITLTFVWWIGHPFGCLPYLLNIKYRADNLSCQNQSHSPTPLSHGVPLLSVWNSNTHYAARGPLLLGDEHRDSVQKVICGMLRERTWGRFLVSELSFAVTG